MHIPSTTYLPPSTQHDTLHDVLDSDGETVLGTVVLRPVGIGLSNPVAPSASTTTSTWLVRFEERTIGMVIHDTIGGHDEWHGYDEGMDYVCTDPSLDPVLADLWHADQQRPEVVRQSVRSYINGLDTVKFGEAGTVQSCPACGTIFRMTDDEDGLYPDKMVWAHYEECDGCAAIDQPSYTG